MENATAPLGERDDDPDDDKPLVQPKSKAAPKPKSKPKAAPKATAVQRERAHQVRVRAKKREEREDEAPIGQLIQETALPKPKKRAKSTTPSKKEEDVHNVLRASRKAATAKASPARKKVERFIIADPPVSEKRRGGYDDDMPISNLIKKACAR